MKKLYFIFIALIIVGLSSCSSGKTDEEKAQDMAEGILKQMTGKDVDIKTEKNEDGETVNMTIKTDDGELSINGNESKLPDDFPDIYIAKGEKSNISVMASGESKVVTFKIISDKAPEDVKEEIKSNMESWTNSMDMSTADGSMLSFDKEGVASVTITIGKSDDKSEIAYMVNYKTE